MIWCQSPAVGMEEETDWGAAQEGDSTVWGGLGRDQRGTEAESRFLDCGAFGETGDTYWEMEPRLEDKNLNLSRQTIMPY